MEAPFHQRIQRILLLRHIPYHACTTDITHGWSNRNDKITIWYHVEGRQWHCRVQNWRAHRDIARELRSFYLVPRFIVCYESPEAATLCQY